MRFVEEPDRERKALGGLELPARILERVEVVADLAHVFDGGTPALTLTRKTSSPSSGDRKPKGRTPA